MRFQGLGRAHRLGMIPLKVVTLVSLVGGGLIGFLVFAWGLLPLPFWVNLALFEALALTIAKVSEVPFTREVLHTPLKGRVSTEP